MAIFFWFPGEYIGESSFLEHKTQPCCYPCCLGMWLLIHNQLQHTFLFFMYFLSKLEVLKFYCHSTDYAFSDQKEYWVNLKFFNRIAFLVFQTSQQKKDSKKLRFRIKSSIANNISEARRNFPTKNIILVFLSKKFCLPSPSLGNYKQIWL